MSDKLVLTCEALRRRVYRGKGEGGAKLRIKVRGGEEEKGKTESIPGILL